MSLPPNYTPTTSFADDESLQAAGRSTVRTAALDQEFADIEATTDALIANQRLIQRDDGKLQDLLVEPYALSEQTRALLVAGGASPRGAWATNTNYAIKDLVQNAGIAYMCLTAHNSGPTFNAGFWLPISGDGSAAASAIAAAASQAEASASASVAVSAASVANISAVNADLSADAAAASELAAQNAADSIAGLSPVNLSAFMLDFLANTAAAAARADLGALGLSDAASQAEAEAGTLATKIMTPLAGAQQLDGRLTKLYGASSVARSMPARFGDVVDIKDWFNVGGVVNNDAALAALITYLTANPGKTLRGHATDIYACSFSSQTLPAGTRLRLEGGRFLWSGLLGGGNATALTLAAGIDFDTLRFEVASAGTFRRLLQINGSRGDLLELVCQNQVANYGGSNLDFGLRLYGQGNRIHEVKAKNVDRALMAYGEGATASLTQKGLVIDNVDVENYVTGAYLRNLEDFQIKGHNIRGRSANALPDPGHNGILTAGIKDGKFGPGTVKNSGEHAYRIGGRNGSETLTSRISFTNPTSKGAGQCGFKAWSGSNAELIKGLTVTGGRFVDSGDDGNALGFNDFGMMIQACSEAHFDGCVVQKEDLAASAYDAVYVSQADGVYFTGLVANHASRRGLHISEFNGNGTDQNSSNTVNVWGAHIAGHAAEGVYVDCVGTDMRDLMVSEAHIIGGTIGVKWNGAKARAQQPCYFSAAIRGQSGLKFDCPSVGAEILKTVDMLA